MVPVFPTNTFPNHVSLVTGVRPAVHGIVNNSFRDPERGPFRKESDPTWIEVEPLWSLLAGAGIRSAAYHWVGSEGNWRSGRGPAEWRRFDASVPEAEKVDQILTWLTATPEERPRLITAWFRGADAAGHREGPGSPLARSQLLRQDAALQRLLLGIGERDLWDHTTLLLVSDHGMTEVHETVDLALVLREAGIAATVYGGGGFATVWLSGSGVGTDRVLAVARALGLEAWRRGDRPGVDDAHLRFGQILVMAPVGVGIVSAGSRRGALGAIERFFLKRELRGSHGYSPEEPSMEAFFAAVGRGVQPQSEPVAPDRPSAMRTVDVAPTILRLLGQGIPPWMEGRAIELSTE